ncbi:arylsulfatase [Flammeovirga yaeyamensis]|uniref:Arylsulfatase n=1 Tax=Flammeovirga yaeyamensis TaxID=367791 RepID=A0AAX1NCN1_9BACT|nr:MULTISPECIES: arylsulfatase [Flammeovirga]ANQ51535.1 arylsulfatase [Flammeovirga sp. MY04]MBB3696733.1 arylsulfatase [Flammeovirga yaeyamensis]NMF33403.1 arylsulfatase [Flammeovirga yaeyamensis]QWG05323.1 arylsulfatase [Flammeovirga yaeyamensis]
MKKAFLIFLSLLFSVSLLADDKPIKKSKKPNIVILWGDDIGQFNLSFWNRGQMGYQTPNIDRIADEGIAFTDYYGEQSCTAGRSSFLTGQSPIRSGLSKVGLPGANAGFRPAHPSIAWLLKKEGYNTAQFGKNHFGDRDEMLPTEHGFDEFFGNLYHLNAEEEPEHPDYPQDPGFKERFGPRGVIHSYADGRVEDTGPLTKKRMETVDREITQRAIDWLGEKSKEDAPFFLWYNTVGMHFPTYRADDIKGLSGQGGDSFYADVMVDHDRNIGKILAKLEELGLMENTIIMYSTDNGPHYNEWPDGAVTPYRSEKNTNWEGAYRVPCHVMWKGKIKEGQILNGIVSHQDWLPTIMALVGVEDIKGKLEAGIDYAGRSVKTTIDGYNMMPYFLGEVKESPRRNFIYTSDDGDITCVRMDDWKVVFMEQRAHTMQVWAEPFVSLRLPKIFNIRRDPYERADTDSNSYWAWLAKRAPYIYKAGAVAGEFIQSLYKYPQIEKIDSFSIDGAMEDYKRWNEERQNSKN